jgi:hypothetical protein
MTPCRRCGGFRRREPASSAAEPFDLTRLKLVVKAALTFQH